MKTREQPLRLSTVNDLRTLVGNISERHPLIEVVDLATSFMPPEYVNQRLVTDFYTITVKTKTNSPFHYGRRTCDFSRGTLFAMAPDQTMQVDCAHQIGDLSGMSLFIHPDFLIDSPVFNQIRQLGYFDYDVTEALHVSEQERDIIFGVFAQINNELNNNIDAFSRPVLLANVEVLLAHINRFYHRQFITRSPVNQTTVSQLNQLLAAFFTSGQSTLEGLPSVNHLAQQLHVSPGYLSDLVRAETGLSTQDVIHRHLLEAAKYQLLNSNKTIGQLSHELGFEYPQYFSRLFRKKVGMTPGQFRRRH